MNTIRRTEKSEIEKDKDFYQTHPTMVKALISWLNNSSPELRVLDPCCGKGVIYKELETLFRNVTHFDKYLGDNKLDFLEHKENYDLIIMNPPYSNKNVYRFIDHARKLASSVFCLLPINQSNYNMFHNDYEDIPEFVGKIKMTPKMFLHEGIEFKTGGTASYAWYYWNKDNNTDYSKTWYYNLRDFL